MVSVMLNAHKTHYDMTLVGNMISTGYTSDAAIDKIYSTYGHQLSISNILVKLRMTKEEEGMLIFGLR